MAKTTGLIPHFSAVPLSSFRPNYWDEIQSEKTCSNHHIYIYIYIFHTSMLDDARM